LAANIATQRSKSMRKDLTRLFWLAAILLCICGCAARPSGEETKQQEAAAAAVHDHAHGAGPHGGVVADWGGGKYHVEFTVDHDTKQAAVYVLAGDATTPASVKTDKLLLSITEPAFQVELTPDTTEGEGDKASRFVGKHDNLGLVRDFSGTISGVLDGTPYAADFSEQTDHEHK
jgi:hypothetical protein